MTILRHFFLRMLFKKIAFLLISINQQYPSKKCVDNKVVHFSLNHFSMTARHHHYLSQFYLKGFTKGQAKKSKLSVIDVKEKKSFETIPRNVGGIRDFNRIDIEGVDQNQLESELAKFEDEAATALKQLKETLDFSGERKELIICLMALIAVRSPERREHMRLSQAQIAEKIMGMIHDSKDLWESQIQKMKEDDPTYESNVTYEEAKEFFEGKKYTIDVVREFHIHMEMVQIDAIIPCLLNRNWLLVTSNENTGPFITTDWPVNLSWKEPEKVPAIYRDSPGFGLKATEVYFPVSQNLALIGEFDGKKGVLEASKELVSVLKKCYITSTSKSTLPNLILIFLGKQ